jgi:predicted nucleic acid-binding protein
MITAVDTNILLDIFLPDPHFLHDSLERLKKCERNGSLIICEIVYAELAAAFPSKSLLDHALGNAGIQLKSSNRDILWNASEIWKKWIKVSGSKRDRTKILPDFIIGAHASYYASQFLTRDRGFYRTCFHRLPIVTN